MKALFIIPALVLSLTQTVIVTDCCCSEYCPKPGECESCSDPGNGTEDDAGSACTHLHPSSETLVSAMPMPFVIAISEPAPALVDTIGFGAVADEGPDARSRGRPVRLLCHLWLI